MLLNDEQWLNTSVEFRRAYVDYRAGNYVAARQRLATLPDTQEKFYLLGVSLLEDTTLIQDVVSLREAIANLEKFHALSGTYYANVDDALGLAHYYLGQVSTQRGDTADACESLEAATRHLAAARQDEPNYFSPRHNLGLVQMARGQTDDAIANFNASLALLLALPNPMNVAKNFHSLQNAYNQLADVYFYDRGDATAALEMLDNAKNCSVRAAAQDLNETSQLALREVLAISNLETFNLSGHTHYKLGNFAAAQQDYQAAHALDQTDSNILNQIGMCAFKLANFADAEYYFRACLALAQADTQDEVDALINLTEALNKNGKSVEAITFAERGQALLSRFPDNEQKHEDMKALQREQAIALCRKVDVSLLGLFSARNTKTDEDRVEEHDAEVSSVVTLKLSP